MRNLSGGNQQKVLLARWLAIAPRLLILDEPTRGIDIGAKAEIQKLVFNLAENGMSVLFISAELEEVLRLSHRIVVLRDRHVVADLENDGLTVDSLLALIAEGSNDDESGCRGPRSGRRPRRRPGDPGDPAATRLPTRPPPTPQEASDERPARPAHREPHVLADRDAARALRDQPDRVPRLLHRLGARRAPVRQPRSTSCATVRRR